MVFLLQPCRLFSAAFVLLFLFPATARGKESIEMMKMIPLDVVKGGGKGNEKVAGTALGLEHRRQQRGGGEGEYSSLSSSSSSIFRWDPVLVIRSSRKLLVGPGSSPPTCRSRCGGCSPCRPVHVAIHPGRVTLQEYYPEAWRCKCGDKLFMP